MFEIAALTAIIILGSFTQGLTGFGLALVSVSLLALLIDVKVAVPLAGIFGWLITFPVVWKMRHSVHWKTALIMVAGSLPGSWLGAELLKRLPPDTILVVMGTILVLSALYAQFSRGPVFKSAPHGLSLAAGFASGSLGAGVGEPGPPVIAYTSLLPWRADEAKSTLMAFFMLQMIGAIFSFYQKDLLTDDVFSRIWVMIPGFVVGTVLGMYAYSLLNRYKINYHRIVHAFLAVIGVVLIIKHI